VIQPNHTKRIIAEIKKEARLAVEESCGFGFEARKNSSIHTDTVFHSFSLVPKPGFGTIGGQLIQNA
jgi:hypothetical protein